MKLYVEQKIFSLKRTFNIKNENNEMIYELVSNSYGNGITLLTSNNEEIANIDLKYINLNSYYSISIKNKLSCSMYRKINLFKYEYQLDNGYKVIREIAKPNYTIYDQNSNIIGIINKRIIAMTNTYDINIIDENNKEMVLSIFAAICNDNMITDND